MHRKGSYVDYMSETVSCLQDQLAEHTIALDVLGRKLSRVQLSLHTLTREFLRSQNALPDANNDPVT